MMSRHCVQQGALKILELFGAHYHFIQMEWQIKSISSGKRITL